MRAAFSLCAAGLMSLLAVMPSPAAWGSEAAAAPAASAASAPKSADGEDPMEKISRKLAERLGATHTMDSKGVLRISSHASEPAARPAPRGASAASRRTAKTDARSEVAAHQETELHWDYEGAGGPDTWGRLKPEFAQCAAGKRQSPIDIRDGIKVMLDPIQFDYKPSGFTVIDTGHTVQVNVSPGNTIEVMGRRYELVQFHFHRPSEERVSGRSFDMVAHLVHKDADGRLAVVAVLLERGAAQPIVQQVWNNLPLERGDAVQARSAIDLNLLLPQERGYYTYMGSLTTPPCSEGVLWMVMKQPMGISPEQVAIFSRLYPMNARPVQPANNRLIKESS